MNKTLKILMLKISKLSLKNQQWIKSQLNPHQLQLYKRLNIDQLLLEARKFKQLPTAAFEQEPKLEKNPFVLAPYARELAEQEPLYIAIILNQGHFNWEHEFINVYKHPQHITELLSKLDVHIKESTQKIVFQQWQSQLSFAEQLGVSHA